MIMPIQISKRPSRTDRGLGFRAWPEHADEPRLGGDAVPAGDAEDAQQGRNVKTDREMRDAELAGDKLVGGPLCQQLEHFALASSEDDSGIADTGWSGSGTPIGLDHMFAGQNPADSLDTPPTRHSL
jgi:hypothetical protein